MEVSGKCDGRRERDGVDRVGTRNRCRTNSVVGLVCGVREG